MVSESGVPLLMMAFALLLERVPAMYLYCSYSPSRGGMVGTKTWAAHPFFAYQLSLTP